MSCVEVVKQRPCQVGTVRASQGDHEGWQAKIGTEIQLLNHSLEETIKCKRMTDFAQASRKHTHIQL